MNIIITALLLVRRERNGILSRDGNNAAKTCGIVSPTMTQNAMVPPKALFIIS